MNGLVAAILALATTIGLWRSPRRGFRFWAQPLLAVLLYLLLFPPTIERRGEAAILLTPGATAAQVRALPPAQRLLALPDARAPAQAQPVPDLATLRRRWPAIDRLTIVGAGLPLRDQDAADGLHLRFEAAPPIGIVDLQADDRATLGRQWPVRGRALPPVARLELRDPAGTAIDTATPDREGRFSVSTPLKGLGPIRFELHGFDPDGAPVDRVSLPVTVEPGMPLRLRIRAGAPQAELKYLRRWAENAGLDWHSRIGLAPSLAIHEADAAWDGPTLADTDLVIVDERAWAELDGAEKARLIDAVHNGLGLLLRVGAPLSPAIEAEWAALGIATSALDTAQSVTLDHALGLRSREPFTTAPVRLSGESLKVLLADDEGQALLAWIESGRGRIGITRLSDSYRLVLRGEASRFGSLWARIAGTLARAVPEDNRPELPSLNWVAERILLCGLDHDAHAIDADGQAVDLVLDRQACAAYWPDAPGWHQLSTGGRTWPFYVRATDDGAALRHARNRAWTEAQAQNGSGARATPVERPLPRWPLWLAWLLLAALLWHRERSEWRLG